MALCLMMILWAVSASMFALLPSCVAAMAAPNATRVSDHVTVHVFERYAPFESVTVVGAFATISVSPDFRLVLSFRAARYNASNAATMACFSIDQRTSKWTQLSATNSTSRVNSTQAFCARRITPNAAATTSSAIAVAQFQRREASGLLVHAIPGMRQDLLGSVEARGWLTPPLASFEVTRFKQWRSPPTRKLVSDLTVVDVEDDEQAKQVCLEIDGAKPRRLCVAYVVRSLQDIDHRETFVAGLFFQVGRAVKGPGCGMDFTAVRDAKTAEKAWLEERDGTETLLCYKRVQLTTDTDGRQLFDTSQLVNLVLLDSSQPDRNKRLQITFQSPNAWDFPLEEIDKRTIAKFEMDEW